MADSKKTFDVKLYQSLIKMSQTRTKKFYTKSKDHNYKLYNNQTYPLSYLRGDMPAPTGDNMPPNYNHYYADVEAWRASISLRNPRVFISATKDKFFIVHKLGETDYIEDESAFDTGVFEQIVQQGGKSYMDAVKGLEYIVLDGAEASKLVEYNVNNMLREKHVEEAVSRCVTDGIIAGMGAVWVNWKSDSFGAYRSETENLKNEDVSVEYVDLAEEIAIDPFVKTPYDIVNAKWVARRFQYTDEELIACKDNYIKGRIDEMIESNKAMSYFDENNEEQKEMISDLSPDDKNKDHFKTRNLWEVWAKPSMAERKKGERGKVVVIAENYDKPLAEVPYPHKTDKCPLKLLWFNVSNTMFFPTADIQNYESVLADKNTVRWYIRNKTQKDAVNKVIFNSSSGIKEEDLEKIKTPYDELIPVAGFDKDQLFAIQPPASTGEFYMQDQKLNEDHQRISRMSDITRGLSGERKETATTSYIQNQRSMIGIEDRIDVIGKLYKEIVHHSIDLIQQYYTTERQVMISGSPKPEWTQKFSYKDIQGDYQVEVDVYSMMPKNDMVEQKMRMDLFNLVLGTTSNPNTVIKMISEGFLPNISEHFKEFLHSLNLRNGKLFQAVPENIKKDAQIAYARFLGIAPEILGAGSSPAMMRPASSGSGQSPTNMALDKEMMSEGQPTPASEIQNAGAGNGQEPANPLAGGGMLV